MIPRYLVSRENGLTIEIPAGHGGIPQRLLSSTNRTEIDDKASVTLSELAYNAGGVLPEAGTCESKSILGEEEEEEGGKSLLGGVASTKKPVSRRKTKGASSKVDSSKVDSSKVDSSKGVIQETGFEEYQDNEVIDLNFSAVGTKEAGQLEL